MTTLGFLTALTSDVVVMLASSVIIALLSFLSRKTRARVARLIVRGADVVRPRQDRMVTERLDDALPPTRTMDDGLPPTQRWDGGVTVPAIDELVLISASGTRIPVRPGFTVGRRPSSGLVLRQDVVSRDHATITVRGRRWVVRDHESMNGTFVNGRRVPSGGEGIVLGDGETVTFGRGGPSFRVRLAGVTARA